MSLPIQRRAIVSAGHHVFLSLIPSFLADVIRPERRRRASKLHSTSYLDGLRGLAAFSVFAYHYTDYNHKFFLPAYGSNPADLGSSLLQLPYIRVIYAGVPMVHIFFVISGFALAYRPLQCLYDQMSFQSSSPASVSLSQISRPTAISKCHALLASSAFRRPIRLWGPPLALTLGYVPLVLLGFFHGFLTPQSSLWAQLSHWAADAISAVTWPWGWDEGAPQSRYNPHLWTIPIEFAHSMLLFLVLMVVARLRTSLLRQAALALGMVYALLLYGRWAAFEFLAGALLADFHLSRESREQVQAAEVGKPSYSPKTTTRSITVAESVIHVFILAFSGYIISWPSRSADFTPSYVWLASHVPSAFASPSTSDEPDLYLCSRFWFSLAAFGLVWTCGRVRTIKRVLESGPAQYAGKISFAFYILQHPVLNICEHSVLGAPGKARTVESEAVRGWGVRGLTGEGSPMQRTLCWFLGLCVLGALLICIADFFSRMVDGPCVRLARRVEKMVFLEEEEKVLLPVRK